ncbi:hypothetical protein [Gilvimarinus sp. DA14]|uniref:hypothetical protein n=1 Tax=Gilvimarinus sp. DA14 TaxID=2956798 RepID=UPI0020B6C82A|nr:hypothetical protein [Gilvimarinus sp. DA14]UTF59749.1 hypothetical protein NHM04_14945 [Gilvimarinus sp. DA14]
MAGKSALLRSGFCELLDTELNEDAKLLDTELSLAMALEEEDILEDETLEASEEDGRLETTGLLAPELEDPPHPPSNTMRTTPTTLNR